MIIQVEWDRIDGLKSPPRLAGVILDRFECELAGVFEVKAILEKMLEQMPESLDGVRTVRLDDA